MINDDSFEEQFIMLNIKDKVDQAYFDRPNMFFKIVNLHTKNPLVQIGHDVFNGTYDQSTIGTTLLFQESEEEVLPNYGEEPSAINLKCFGKTMKVLSLRWQKLPEEIANIEPQDLIKIEFKDNYATVLHKIEEGVLDINYVIKSGDNDEKDIAKITLEDKEDEEKMEGRIFSKKKINESIPVNRLNVLRHTVVGQAKPPDYYEQCNLNMKSQKDYFILKELFLKSLDYKNILLNIDKENIRDFVDIENSIRDQIIEKKKVDELTDLDKQNLINLKNFDNLSIPMQLTLLIEHLQDEKKHLTQMSKEELGLTDEFDRTPKDRYRLLKSLAKDLQYYLFLRIGEDQLEAKVSNS